MSENLQNLNLTYPAGVGQDSGYDPSRTNQLLGSHAAALRVLATHLVRVQHAPD